MYQKREVQTKTAQLLVCIAVDEYATEKLRNVNNIIITSFERLNPIFLSPGIIKCSTLQNNPANSKSHNTNNARYPVKFESHHKILKITYNRFGRIKASVSDFHVNGELRRSLVEDAGSRFLEEITWVKANTDLDGCSGEQVNR